MNSCAKIQIAGSVGTAASFLMLLIGTFRFGAGHGSPTMYLVGLMGIPASALALIAGTAISPATKRFRQSVYGMLAIFLFVVVGVFFHDITLWVETFPFHDPGAEQVAAPEPPLSVTNSTAPVFRPLH